MILSLPKKKDELEVLYKSLLSVKNIHPSIGDWLKDSVDVLNKLNSKERDETSFKWRQGAIQAIDDVIQCIADAKKTLERIT